MASNIDQLLAAADLSLSSSDDYSSDDVSSSYDSSEDLGGDEETATEVGVQKSMPALPPQAMPVKIAHPFNPPAYPQSTPASSSNDFGEASPGPVVPSSPLVSTGKQLSIPSPKKTPKMSPRQSPMKTIPQGYSSRLLGLASALTTSNTTPNQSKSVIGLSGQTPDAPPLTTIQHEINQMITDEDSCSSSSESCSSSESEDEEADFSSSENDPSTPSSVPENKGEKQIKELSRNEEVKLRKWRILVLISLLGVGLALSLATFFVLRNKEEVDYQHSFDLLVSNVIDDSRVKLATLTEAMSDLSSQFTVRSLSSPDKFPTVTLPYFEVAAEAARSDPLLSFVSFAPLVTFSQRDVWQKYSVAQQGWIDESWNLYTGISPPNGSGSIRPYIYSYAVNGSAIESPSAGLFLPQWQMSPPPTRPGSVNFNLFSERILGDVFRSMTTANMSALSPVVDTSFVIGDAELGYESTTSIVMNPVHENLQKESWSTSGAVVGVIDWNQLFVGVLPADVDGIICYLRNSAGQSYSYELNGKMASRVNATETSDMINNETAPYPLFMDKTSGIQYFIGIHATETFRQDYMTNLPMAFAIVVALGFVFVAGAFVVYDRFVKRRSDKVIGAVVRTTRIISSLFPANVHDRLFGNNEMSEAEAKNLKKKSHYEEDALRSETVGDKSQDGREAVDDDDEEMFKTAPIADLFPSTTIMFADLKGFTAWSSTREPSQVFVLLETVYRAFDLIAKKRGVFKVETVGDCYVAVCGLPNPNPAHAVVMSCFARDCLRKMDQLTRKLEVKLGPDTGDLCMRIGLHSGPVTGGVLRGEGSRFQLFGDTMNTASRTETTGEGGRIHLSQSTADLLAEAGKSAWFKPREEKVFAKGKGMMQTYWLKTGKSRHAPKSDDGATIYGTDMEDSDSDFSDSFSDAGTANLMENLVSDKTRRLVDWNVAVLARLLKKIIVWRQGTAPNAKHWKKAFGSGPGSTVIDEVQETILLPECGPDARIIVDRDVDAMELDSVVMEQLRDYVMNIAIMYKDNPFHNFEHASHVTMSLVKLMSRIIAPSSQQHRYGDQQKSQEVKTVSELHRQTYGLATDPLTQFACVFAALIHDVDHPGVPNAQLVKEEAKIARHYKGKSVAEQNSLDLAYGLLMESDYELLRATLCANETELRRFRHLVVNSVMATDIVDKNLKAARDARWDRAFSESAEADSWENSNRKATIVIEHLIQASDVSHTLQHWQVYRKWNERLFMEMYTAFKEGRAENDPSVNWYEGEMGFFDYYIIPLAKKLRDCGVFGVSCDEMLDYATNNREEWEAQGQEVVEYMITAYEAEQKRKSEAIRAKEMRLKPAAPESTFQIGENVVTKTSVTEALGSLMMKVQQMEMAEQQFTG